MDGANVTALISAGAAVFGGLATAIATRSVEAMRLRGAARREDARTALDAMVGFRTALDHWVTWLLYLVERVPEMSDDQYLMAREEYNVRNRALVDSYARVVLFCSDWLLPWLLTDYPSKEGKAKDAALPLIQSRELPSGDALEDLQALVALQEEVTEKLRHEIMSLRSQR